MEIEKFKGSLIAFDFDSDMICATDMIKAFPEKKMNNFLRQQQTKDFISILLNNLTSKSDTLKSASNENQVLRIIKGNHSNGQTQGTWMHKRLAFKFAAWLSPEFENFVYEIFDNFINEKLKNQQRQLDYFWDRSDLSDLYKIKNKV